MILPSGHSRARLIRRFAALGPYLREQQCKDVHFFFDCLAVCVSVKPAPEKREFWGWWLELTAEEQGFFSYRYRFGLFDKLGLWRPEEIEDADLKEKLETTRRDFHVRLDQMLQALEPAGSLRERP